MTLRMKIYLLVGIWLLAVGCLNVTLFKATPENTDMPVLPVEPSMVVETPTPTPLPPIGSSATVEVPTSTAPPPSNETPVTPAVTTGLNPTGPWLLLQIGSELWVSNPDTSGLQPLIENVAGWQALDELVQPGGSHIAVITSSGDGIHHLALNLLSLPGGVAEKVIDLTSAQTEPQGDFPEPGTPASDALRAITEHPAVAWSPDGTKLVFTGYMDGPSADPYLYDLNSGQVQRIIQLESQNYWPAWSPDGSQIFFMGANAFGTGAGYSMAGVWSAYSDGSNPTMLYEPFGAGEELYGWAGGTTAVLGSWSPMCGSAMLRLYDVYSTQKTILHEECFDHAAVSSDGAVMFSDPDGLYLFHSGDEAPARIDNRSAGSIQWLPHGYTFVVRFNDGGILSFDPFGTIQQEFSVQVNDNWRVDVDSYGAIWGWTSADPAQPGVWYSGPGLGIQQIYSESASLPVWDYQNNLLFVSQGWIYRTTFNAHYQDTAAVTALPGDVSAATWVAWP